MFMKLTLEALQVLDAIDRRGSFAAAAAELGRVPSALTYQVRKLEDDLDALLFDRRGHRAVLTPAGRELLREGRNLLRTAGDLECRVRRLATGWEPELRIALDDLIPATRVLPLVEAFFAVDSGTRVRMSREVLGGGWDALAAGRAELAIGVSGDAPAGGGYGVRALGTVEFVFVVAPSHPLAGAPEPLGRDLVQRYRAVAVGDTSRSLPPRSIGLVTGQEVLTVPDLATKVAAHVAGLGCGFVPRTAAAAHLAAGRLVAKEVEEAKPHGRLAYAWRTDERGKALKWFLKQLESPALRERLLAPGRDRAAPQDE
jgi:DNA-binding transcriptional LysR family regulator